MMMNHLVIYYLEFVLRNYASSKHEGEEKTRNISPESEHHEAFSGVRSYHCFCCFFLSPEMFKLPYWPPVECSMIRQLFLRQSNFLDEDFLSFDLSAFLEFP